MNDLERLADLISNLNLSESVSEINTMATERPKLDKQHLDAIPKYDGNPATLSIFISACEYVLTTFANLNQPDDPINEFIIRSIINKLTGRALVLVGSRDITSWNEIKTLLYNCFADQRDEKGLLKDLQILRPHKGEGSYQFGIRCQDARSLLLSRLKICEEDPNYRALKTKYYDEIALQVYLDNLPAYLDLAVRLRNPENLEKAMSIVLEEENNNYRRNRPNTLLQSRPIRANMTIQQNSVPYVSPFGMPSSSYNTANSQPQTRQPTTPFVQQPRFTPRPNVYQSQFNQPKPFRPFPTQNSTQFNRSNVFKSFKPPQTNQNVFQPSNKPPQYPKPTPMDISSGNTNLRSQRRPINTPRYMAEELFHQDTQEYINDDYDEEYYAEENYENYYEENFQEENLTADVCENNDNENFREVLPKTDKT